MKDNEEMKCRHCWHFLRGDFFDGIDVNVKSVIEICCHCGHEKATEYSSVEHGKFKSEISSGGYD